MDVVGILMVAVFVALQAGLVFGTAWLGVWLLRGRLGKAAAMWVACGAWIVLMVAGYMLLGGENTFKDGYGLIASLCLATAACSFLILRRWTRPRPA